LTTKGFAATKPASNPLADSRTLLLSPESNRKRIRSLSGSEQPKKSATAISRHASPEIADLLCHSILLRPSSVELQWKNFAIERRAILPEEKSEITLRHHFMVLWGGVAEGEGAYRGGRFSPYKKFPNTITTVLPGTRPAMRSRSRHEVIVGALHPDFLRGIEEELDTRPNEAFQPLYGTNDPDLRTLLSLLQKESETGGRYGTLYTESLLTALATRLLFAGRLRKPPENPANSPLPRRPLQRVLERMKSDLGESLGLEALAAETGYSRAHFLRMFRAATGQTPHRYLLQLRLEKARALITTGSMPLIDVATVCGFSNHAHLTTAFRSRFGVTPSAYRRSS
jgi:AraC family transcriptional regulator